MIEYILASLIMFFIPGYTFVNAVFPGKNELDEDLDLLYRIAFSIAMSVVFVILVGYILGNLHLIVGYGSFYESVYIWTGLLLLTVMFFLLGWYRGAYQCMGKIHPLFDRPSPKTHPINKDDFELIDEMENLVREQHKIKKEIKDAEKENLSDIEELEDRLEEVTEKLKDLEEKRVEQLEAEG